MYILLTSKFVFNAKDYNEILRRNKQCKVYFPKKLWENLSDDAQNLCSLMLQKHPENRISAVEALEHQWFKNNGDDPAPKAVVNIERNMFNQKTKMNNDLNDSNNINMNALADENENNQGTLLKDNLNVTDLMTSSPIMNKKKMFH
jgi:serine/threonine protein kinase